MVAEANMKKILVIEDDKVVASELCNLLNNSGVGAGQTVMHFHLHVLPRYADDEIDFHQVDHEPNFAELEKLYAKLTQ